MPRLQSTQSINFLLYLFPSRDHGVPGYIRYREICRTGGGRKVRRFSDLGTNISREVRTNTMIAS